MNTHIFIATTGQGLARAERDANDDGSVEVLLTNQDVRCLAADPLNPAVIYAGVQGNGVLRSDDGGKSWRPAGLPGQIVKSLAVSPHRPDTVYALAELEGMRAISSREPKGKRCYGLFLSGW